ncbi:MAG TPA: signal peptidase I [Candidatus Bathyarchaeia archaeon]|nr:signal peptidase I [Candidatus Bathyarchaeia archaeon]
MFVQIARIIKKVGAFFLDIIETGVIALSIFIVVYLFVMQPHEVKGNSMFPSFEHGEFLLTDKISYRLNQPQRGDVIVFRAPLNTQFDYIKRIIGLPRETVMVKDGYIYIQNQKVDEIYLPEDTVIRAGNAFSEGKPVTIPEGQYFVMGDNRAHSSDSRDWGTVPRDNIVGRVWFRYWPFDRFGKIDRAVYTLNHD